MSLLRLGRIVRSPATGNRYRIEAPLGEGGFGHAYLASQLGPRGKVIADVCLKTTLDQASWHRESYFGELLSRNRRVIQLLDSFPLATTARKSAGMLYCLALELAEHGTVADYLEQTRRPWPAARAVREIIALLRLLDHLHGTSATHRDLTPMNVFVCGRGTLKLGDFGIARHNLPGQPVPADFFNPMFVTRGHLDNKRKGWLATDDVFQMGQLLAMLLTGQTERALAPGDVASMNLDEPLAKVLRRAIGPRRTRYADAFEMLQALQGDEGTPTVTLKSLVGKEVTFSGPLSIRRFDAEMLVVQAGGIVTPSVSPGTDVLVQGRRGTGRGGYRNVRLEKAEKLIRQGRPIHIIGEIEFRRLVR